MGYFEMVFDFAPAPCLPTPHSHIGLLIELHISHSSFLSHPSISFIRFLVELPFSHSGSLTKGRCPGQAGEVCWGAEEKDKMHEILGAGEEPVRSSHVTALLSQVGIPGVGAESPRSTSFLPGLPGPRT